MLSYLKTWLELKTDRRAVTALEYGLIAAVMGALIIAAFGTLGTWLEAVFAKIGALMP